MNERSRFLIVNAGEQKDADFDPKIFGCPADLFSGQQNYRGRSRKTASFFNLKQQSDWKRRKLSLGKRKKKENNNKAKGKKNQTTYNLKTYRGALFISIRVKMEREFRRLCCSFFLFLNDSIFLESGYAAGLHIAFAAAASSEMLVVFVSLEVS